MIKHNLIQPTSEPLKEAFHTDIFYYEHPEGVP